MKTLNIDCDICKANEATMQLPLVDSPDDYTLTPVCAKCWDYYMAQEGIQFYD